MKSRKAPASTPGLPTLQERHRAVLECLTSLEARLRANPPDAPRIREILALAREQLADDTPRVSPQRFGKAAVRTLPLPSDPPNPPPARPTPDQVALAVGMRPDIEKLTPEQQEAIHAIFYARLTYARAAALLGLSRSALQARVRRALRALWRLGFRFGRPVEAVSKARE